jgi:ABC-type lipoprotein release transport system permease subunit
MKLYFQLAWRNIWRNKKRSLISLASIFFSVLLALLFQSVQDGSNDIMVDTVVDMYSGGIQVMGKDFWKKRSLDQSMEYRQQQVEAIRKTEHITNVTPRLESFALVSHGLATKVSPVVGINPITENNMTGLQKKLVAGAYLTIESKGTLVAEGLARALNLTVGDSIVLYGQGYQGVTAVGVFAIEGIVKFPIPEMNNAMVFLALPHAQWLFVAPNRITGLVIMIDKMSRLNEVKTSLQRWEDSKHDVMTWRDMLPEFVQSVAMNDASTVMILLILYAIVGFGIFGTVMMMATERRREFGVLISVGMNRWRLIGVTTLESIMISMVGAAIGASAGYPLMYYFYVHPIILTGDYAKAMLAYGMEPILPLNADVSTVILHGTIVAFCGIMSSLYPLFFIRRLHPVRAVQGK